MKEAYMILVVASFVILSGCQQQNKESPDMSFASDQEVAVEDAQDVFAGNDSEDMKTAAAKMYDTDGNVIGNVSFYQKSQSALVKALFNKGIPKGFHGFHIHETGLCDPFDKKGAFLSAGGHHNPDYSQHGTHAGDMPPLYGLHDGSAYLITELDRFDVRQLARENRAVVVHSGADNFGNIPKRYQLSKKGESGPDKETLRAGDVGSRISCGVIKFNN
ncbi:superoxide dismutase family protein [Bacillus piscicola]|uniref:superoxide dismutase family protein n=1 Tax=Bacillus piscicola TaxID=1632684 RepID=UPI001F09E2E5|nr:superoxide dismutase family protein [Bacillus piscicola]